jgi:hypothetical protein
MSAIAVETWAHQEIKMVPILYIGPYSRAILDQHTNGSTCMEGGAHIREGVVVKPTIERYDPSLGRVALKSVSEAYLLRKGATEYQ